MLRFISATANRVVKQNIPYLYFLISPHSEHEPLHSSQTTFQLAQYPILGSLGFNQLQGIVESDETFFRESMKGSEIAHRKAKKRGEKDKKRGISNLKVAVVVAQDRNGNMIARKAGTGRVKAEEIDNVIGEYIHPSSLLCTDTATNYKKFAKLKGLQHETINERQKQRGKKGDIQHPTR